MIKELPSEPWAEWVKRIILHVPDYLSYVGEPTSGGRQRKVRDIARIIRERMQIPCVILQKGVSDWKTKDADGTPVIGLNAGLRVSGDPEFGWRTRSFLRPGDAIIYMGGEDAWPFFVKGAKAYHVGVWWDGPNSSMAKWATGIRTQALFQACRSIACCDTNVINWLRTRDRKHQDSANEAVYIPNCVDLSSLNVSERMRPSTPLKIVFARRFEMKRGPFLMLDTARKLADASFEFELLMSSAEGHDGSDTIRDEARKRGIERHVKTAVNNLNSVYSVYRDADVSVVPTLWSEGTSYTAVESIAAGLPVVTTTVGGLPNLVVPGFNGYVCPPQPASIAEAILRYRDHTLWQRHHRNCLSMREAFSVEAWRDRVMDWLAS
ncbi:glycosyltransferase family 4 protein [Blastochloris sulfoviridis]|uniref:Glycosyltransferase family 4 protein n=1 Tax=Blastochloris sulfoviridis TaxID=50712 RepID=A0A5M6I2W0_9HYPH|nr:glycosyltransferase family 4 protein [Blastochloris sulfoviridis]KAA5602536.1 glycosyltransferase family 4 protein [Blastochloris sulfoviridis]